MSVELIITVAKWAFIGLAVLAVIAGLFIKSDDTGHNDPTQFPPIPPTV